MIFDHSTTLICGFYSPSCIYLYFFAVFAGRANFFYGNRYVNADGDDATRLIFDCDGGLAGMQATVRLSDFQILNKYNVTVFSQQVLPLLCKRFIN